MPLYPVEDDEVMCLQERVIEAQRLAKMVLYHFYYSVKKLFINFNVFFFFFLQNMKDMGDKKRKTVLDDDEEGAMGVRKKNIGKYKPNKFKKYKKK